MAPLAIFAHSGRHYMLWRGLWKLGKVFRGEAGAGDHEKRRLLDLGASQRHIRHSAFRSTPKAGP